MRGPCCIFWQSIAWSGAAPAATLLAYVPRIGPRLGEGADGLGEASTVGTG